MQSTSHERLFLCCNDRLEINTRISTTHGQRKTFKSSIKTPLNGIFKRWNPFPNHKQNSFRFEVGTQLLQINIFFYNLYFFHMWENQAEIKEQPESVFKWNKSTKENKRKKTRAKNLLNSVRPRTKNWNFFGQQKQPSTLYLSHMVPLFL